MRIGTISGIIGLLVVTTFVIQPARAEGPTGEVEAYQSWTQGLYPLVVTADGNWRISYGSDHRLRRVRIGDPARARSIVLPIDATDISASRSGRWVAFAHSQDCVGLIDFGVSGSTAPPQGHWVHIRSGNFSATDCGPPFDGRYHGSSADEIGNYDHGGQVAVALSNDGKLAAIGAGVNALVDGVEPIALVDLRSQTKLASIPTMAGVLRLRFVNHDKDLFVVQAVLGGVYEGNGSPSDVQFAVWNLASGDLQNFVHTPAGSVGSDNLAWGRSRYSGAIYTFADDYPVKGAPFTSLIGANLKHCHARFHALRKVSVGPDRRWSAMVTDPLGRWVAAVGHDTATGGSELVLFAASSGALVKRWPLKQDIGALATTTDGSIIFATTRGTPVQTTPDDFPRLVGGGNVESFHVPTSVLAHPAMDAAWPATPCRIEDEQPGARDIARGKRLPKPNLTIPLSDLKALRSATYKSNDAAYMPFTAWEASDPALYWHDNDGWDANGAPWQPWGVTSNGELWVDRFTNLERIDPMNGKVLGKLPTPRTASRDAMPIYPLRSFVSSQDGTIALTPFGSTQPRRILGTASGATVTDLKLYAGRWLLAIRKKPIDTKGDVDIWAAGYDLITGKQIIARDSDFNRNLDAFEDTPAEVAGLFGESSPPPGTIRWEVSYFGSVRAIESGAQPGQTRTVLWAGLNFKHRLPAKPNGFLGLPLASAAHNVGVVRTNDELFLYDAMSHRILGHEPAKGVYTVRWLPQCHCVVSARSNATGNAHLVISRLP